MSHNGACEKRHFATKIVYFFPCFRYSLLVRITCRLVRREVYFVAWGALSAKSCAQAWRRHSRKARSKKSHSTICVFTPSSACFSLFRIVVSTQRRSRPQVFYPLQPAKHFAAGFGCYLPCVHLMLFKRALSINRSPSFRAWLPFLSSCHSCPSSSTVFSPFRTHRRMTRVSRRINTSSQYHRPTPQSGASVQVIRFFHQIPFVFGCWASSGGVHTPHPRSTSPTVSPQPENGDPSGHSTENPAFFCFR